MRRFICGSTAHAHALTPAAQAKTERKRGWFSSTPCTRAKWHLDFVVVGTFLFDPVPSHAKEERKIERKDKRAYTWDARAHELNWPHELGTALLSEQTDLHPWSAFVVHKEYGDDLGCLDQEAHRVHQIRKERPSPHPKRVILHDNHPHHEPGGHNIYE